MERLQAKLGAIVGGKQRKSHSGRAKRAHSEAAAQALLARGLAALGMKTEDLAKLPKGAPEKTGLAWWLRERTVVSLRWVGQRLGMGHYSRVSQAVGRMKSQPARKLQALKRRLLAAADTPA